MDSFTPKPGYGQFISTSSIVEIRRIIRLDENRVLKMGRRGSYESDTMKYIAANTTIPIPKVHASKFDEEKKDFLIVMDYVSGDTLENVWKTLTNDQKAAVCHQLTGYLAQLRELKSDSIQSINDGPICFDVYQTRWDGPFKSEKEFNTWLVRGNDDAAKYGLTDNHDIHFAHADLSPRNIMVDETGHITGIIDWERAGWYPEYWDTVRMISDKPGKRLMPDYGQHLESTLGKDKYRDEYKALLNVMRSFEDIFSGGIAVQPPPPPPSN